MNSKDITTAEPEPEADDLDPAAPTAGQASTPGSHTVPLEQVVPHPANPRGPVVDDDPEQIALVASVRVNGVLHPPVVLPADRVAKAWPEYADELAGAAYVVLVGHRRRAAAATVYGNDHQLAVNVRDDALADDADAQHLAMTTENVGRRELSVMAEARAFGRHRDRGLTERQIAEAVGCSPSHVHKRLALRALPPAAAAAVDAGKIETTAALELAKLDDGGRARAWEIYAAAAAKREATGRTPSKTMISDEHGPATLAEAIRVYERERQEEQHAADSQLKAAQQGLRLIDPVKEYGYDRGNHRLWKDVEIEAARGRDELVATPDGYGDLHYYSTVDKRTRAERAAAAEPDEWETSGSSADDQPGAARPAPAAAPVRELTPAEQAEREEQIAQDQAETEREHNLRAYALKPVDWPLDLTQRLLVDAILRQSDLDYDVRNLVFRWMDGQPARLVLPSGDPYVWFSRVHELPWEQRCQVAHAISVAHADVRLIDAISDGELQPNDVEFLRAIVAAGVHTLHPWEQRLLDEYDDLHAPVTSSAAIVATVPASGYELRHDTDHGWELTGPDDLYESTDALPDEETEAARYWATKALAEHGVNAASWTECTDDGIAVHYEAVLADDDCE